MIRHWLYFILHSVLIITVLTNTAYAHTIKIAPPTMTHCASTENHCTNMKNKTCCENNTSIEQYTVTLVSSSQSACNDDCNDNDCSSQHQYQPALLSSFDFQSFTSTDMLTNALYQPTRYYHEPLLKPPMT